MIAATIMLAVFAFGVLFFGLRGATTPAHVTRALPPLITLAVLAFLMAFFAFGDYLDALLPNRLEPIESVADYEARQPFSTADGMVLFIGRANAFLPIYTSSTLDIVFPDGVLNFPTGTYNDYHWNEDSNGGKFLNDGDEIVVQTRILGDSQLAVHTIFKGTHDAFLDEMPSYATLPLITTGLSLLIGVVCVAFPLLKWRQLRAKR